MTSPGVLYFREENSEVNKSELRQIESMFGHWKYIHGFFSLYHNTFIYFFLIFF